MNAHTPALSIAAQLALLGVRLPLHAVGKDLADADGHLVLIGTVQGGVPTAHDRAKAFASLINSALSQPITVPVPHEAGFACSEAV